MALLFLDTGFIVAIEATDDQNHTAARSYWQTLTQTPPQIVTTTYVFDEIITFFNSRNRHSKAVEIGQNLFRSEVVEIIHVDERLLEAGWKYFKKHTDKRYSLTDCISFVVMDEMHINTALSFDKHFIQAGFTRIPGK